MSTRDIIGIIVALITGLVPVWMSFNIFELGGIPEKSVLLSINGAYNPIRDLSKWPDNINLKLTINKKPYKELRTFFVELKNIARAPILPNEFYKPLSLKVDYPWEIIGISKLFNTHNIELEWKQVSPQEYQAKPFLMNPGDWIEYSVYVASKNKIDKDPKLTVYARIVGLKDFTKKRSILDIHHKEAMVYLSFTDVLILLVLASIFLVWYYINLSNLGWIANVNKKSIALLIFAALLSFSTAEVIVYYILGGNPVVENLFGRKLLDWRFQWHNWLILIIHIVASIYLYKKSKNKALSEI